MADNYYLVIRDQNRGRTEVQEFRSSQVEKAFSSLFEAEERYHVYDPTRRGGFEIVLIQAESRAGVERAYPHYFVTGNRAQRQRRFIDRLPDLATA
ncbi:hypothetical protein [Cellulosimicrobium composti]|uniref:hypothetical protein n=1 Tax=Cellulosimicrobium composti TaxID=2672572 RepID=UPI0037B94F84